MVTLLLGAFALLIVVGTPIWIAMAGSALLVIFMEGIPLTVAAQGASSPACSPSRCWRSRSSRSPAR
jgi:hypothetical protein